MNSGTHRPEILINNNGDIFMAVVQPTDSVKHFVYHYDSSWNLLDSFPITYITTQYGEPADHRASIINGELVIIYQSIVYKDTSLWVSGPSELNAKNQSLLLTRYSFSGQEMFREPIIANDSLISRNNFPDHCLLWNGSNLLVSTGVKSIPDSVRIREIDISDASILNTYSYEASDATMPNNIGNSMCVIDNKLNVLSYRGVTDTTNPYFECELSISELDNNYNVTNVQFFYDSLLEYTFPTGNIMINGYLLISYDARDRGGSSAYETNPYSPYVMILDSQLNIISNIHVQDSGFAHVHPTMARFGNKLYLAWSKKNNQSPQVFIEEYNILTVPVSLQEPRSLNNNIRIYPNPTSNILKIKISEQFYNHGVIHIIDATGRKVQENIFYGDQLQQEIDISNLKKGIYLLRIESIAEISFVIY